MPRVLLPKPLLFLILAAACSQATSAGSETPAPQAQPDNPGPAFTDADVHFMSGMIAHHQQAVVMGGWATDTAHGAGAAVRALSARIVVGQTDEIAALQRWLRERGQAAAEHAMMMPGMLTADQLASLDAARGTEFDRLFLTFMIQHHQGALTMVDQLLAAQGAAQDGLVFRFAADVHADQTTEIEFMRRMLAALPTGGTTR